MTNQPLKIAIVGSRDFPRLDLVERYIQNLPSDTIIISGGARGVDFAAEQAARERGMRVRIFRADWNKHGKSAGMIRNHDIVNAADKVVAFWDKVSPGTKRTIELAQKAGKGLEVIEV
jgi:hypothetical protein